MQNELLFSLLIMDTVSGDDFFGCSYEEGRNSTLI